MAENPAQQGTKTIAFGCDHAGVELKEALKQSAQEMGFSVIDMGTNTSDSVDYPDYADAVADAMKDGKAGLGVVICGSGIGISIAANRHKHVRAALCSQGLAARLSRQHNNANVLALGARLIGEDTAKDCLRQFLTTQFEGGRHERRIAKMS
ncbi:MAG: ribose 5-phosphate isomerase B [Rickettsiales bacterium]